MTSKSSLEDEVWNQELAYWEYIKAGDLDSYLSLWHRDVIGWPNNQPVPMNRDAIHQLVAGILATIELGSGTVELKPMSVRLYSDVGIVYYEAHIRAQTKAGTDFVTHERYTHTWLQTEQGWKIIGGMSAPL